MIHAAYAMSATLNGNGNGHGPSSLIRQLEKKAAQAQFVPPASSIKQNYVVFQNSDGVYLNGTLVRATRRAVFFDLYSLNTTLRFSEVFQDFRVILQGQIVYSGRGTLRNIVDAGIKAVCEVNLQEAAWKDLVIVSSLQNSGAAIRHLRGN